jgi:hypothetical protein
MSSCRGVDFKLMTEDKAKEVLTGRILKVA